MQLIPPLLRHRSPSSTLDLAVRSFSDAARRENCRERAGGPGSGAAAHPERLDHETPRYGNRVGNGDLRSGCRRPWAETLATIKDRGELICGANGTLAGFGLPDPQGNWIGLRRRFLPRHRRGDL